MCVTIYKPDTKSNPTRDPSPTTKRHTAVSVRLNIVTCPIVSGEIHTRQSYCHYLSPEERTSARHRPT